MSVKSVLQEIEARKLELSELPPLSPEVKEKLEKKFNLEFHFNSNHIEGNTLTYSETELLLIFDETRGNHTVREIEEMKASDVALNMVVDLANDKSVPISEAFIKDLNKVLLVRPYWKEAITEDGQQTRRKISIGDYKRHPNSVRLANGKIFHYASIQETPILMGELVQWLQQNINSNELHPLELAAQVHYKFVLIHPFDDGNGRVSRLLMNYVLFYHSYPPVVIKSEDKANYLGALHDADTGNIDSFIEYIGRQLLWSLELAITAARGETIDEKQDWKKKLVLLRRELHNREEIRFRKDPEVLLRLLNDNLFPAVSRVIIELEEIQRMFLRARYYIRGVENYVTPFSSETKLNIETVKKTFQQYVEVTIMFKEFKLNNEDAFDVELVLRISFDDYKYGISIGKHMILSKLYHQNIVETEIEELANYAGKLLVEEIERIVRP